MTLSEVERRARLDRARRWRSHREARRKLGLALLGLERATLAGDDFVARLMLHCVERQRAALMAIEMGALR